MKLSSVDVRRVTHDHDGDLVVFLIGMRVNRWRRPDLWLPVFREMGPMIAELTRDPDSGFLGATFALQARGPLVVQYWNSVEKLYAYAADRSAAHRPAWGRFNALIRKAPGTVGIWHETYVVERAESIYAGMPASGLARATHAVPVGRKGDRAPERLAA